MSSIVSKLIETPYLPDGAAGGVALRGDAWFALPGVSGPMVLGPSAAVVPAPNQELVLRGRAAKEWPDTQGVRIVLAERAGGAHRSFLHRDVRRQRRSEMG